MRDWCAKVSKKRIATHSHVLLGLRCGHYLPYNRIWDWQKKSFATSHFFEIWLSNGYAKISFHESFFFIRCVYRELFTTIKVRFILSCDFVGGEVTGYFCLSLCPSRVSFNPSVDCRRAVGRLSVDSLWTVGRKSTDRRPTDFGGSCSVFNFTANRGTNISCKTSCIFSF